MRGSNKQINDVPLDKFIDMCMKLNMEHSIELIDSINMRGSNKQINDVPLDKFIDMCMKLNMEHSIELIDSVE